MKQYTFSEKDSKDVNCRSMKKVLVIQESHKIKNV